MALRPETFDLQGWSVDTVHGVRLEPSELKVECTWLTPEPDVNFHGGWEIQRILADGVEVEVSDAVHDQITEYLNEQHPQPEAYEEED